MALQQAGPGQERVPRRPNSPSASSCARSGPHLRQGAPHHIPSRARAGILFPAHLQESRAAQAHRRPGAGSGPSPGDQATAKSNGPKLGDTPDTFRKDAGRARVKQVAQRPRWPGHRKAGAGPHIQRSGVPALRRARHQHLHPVESHQPVRLSCTTAVGTESPRPGDPHAQPGSPRVLAGEVTTNPPGSHLWSFLPGSTDMRPAGLLRAR